MKETHKKGVGNRNKKPKELSGGKKHAFQFLLFLFPLVFLSLLEIALRIGHYGGNTALFVPTPNERSPYYGVNRNVGRRYFSRIDFVPTPRKDLFLKQKPQNCYRIFVLGGSTAAGFPYGNNLMFSRILHRRLMDTFPDRRIEVVNTAFTAINSYTLLDFMDEILKQQPDALLIYAGHNEFYGALGVGSVESFGRYRWMTKTYLALQRLKIVVALGDILRKIIKAAGPSSDLDIKSEPTATTMARIVKDKVIPFDSPLYRSGKIQFYENLREILEKAQKANIPVVLSELVSNIRDQEPFVSVQHDTLPPAIKVFRHAQALESAGRFEEARKTYYRAKDLDALRFRATEEFNRIIHELAGEFGAAVVPMKSLFEESSPHGLIGNNLIHEHLHPNIDGYFLMAEAFYNTMRKEGFISRVWDERNIKPAAYYRRHWGYTAIDSVYAELSVLQLKGGWPFQQTSGPNLALDRYPARTKVDSLVLRILRTRDITLEQGHIELANYYKAKGELEKAFAEYNALIHIVPYLDLFYEPALELLVEMKAYDRAYALANDLRRFEESAFVKKWLGQMAEALNRIPENQESVSEYLRRAQQLLRARRLDDARGLLSKSLQIQETALAHELLGEILLVQKKPADALKHLQRARRMKLSDEPKLLYNLAIAYYMTSDYEKAWETFVQLKKIYPRFPDPGRVESQIKQALGKGRRP
ncbi:MAG: GDSL-type esterase/lipase family protein [candidate division KSB1 bacterium]|nr:GDSL-type esterase/lipase family protein [candidate division KSB1 bacterium]MDZ7314465.1 GDSL-type esterase/lipase family protein [candidate division KSB1 bacterium]